jgi:beta-glucoside operon transcriptional antiterminator
LVIERIINNNVISALDEEGKEIVVMGSGIGFGRKKGQHCDESRIDKVFRMEDEAVLGRFKDLLAKLPLEYIQVSNDIISYAKKELGIPLNQNVYITLTDHISFSLERFQNNMNFTNALHSEIRRFYPAEFSVGIHALRLIEEKTGILLPEDEASAIALHLVNAELNLRVRDIWILTEMMGKMMDQIIVSLPVLKAESLEKDWLLSDLKFMVCRVMTLKPLKEKGDPVLLRYLEERCPELVSVVKGIAGLLETEYRYHMTEEEQLYLTVSLKRIKDLYS